MAHYASAGASPVPRNGAAASTGATALSLTPIEHMQARSVIVSNLPREANEQWVKMLFESNGRIVKVDFKESEGPGSAIVTFASVAEASRALRFDGVVAIGIALQVKPYSVAALRKAADMMRNDFNTFVRLGFEAPSAAVPTGPRNSTAATAIPRFRANETAITHRNLYVLNLPLDATSDQLTALFGAYGTVTHCVILAMLDAQARRRGFIDMSEPEEAKAAIEGLNGFVWHGYPIEASYAIVQRSGGPFNQAEPGRNTVKRNVPRNRFNTGPRRVPEDSSAAHGITVGPGGYLCSNGALGLFSRGEGMSARSEASSPGLPDERLDGYHTPSSNGSGRMSNASRLPIDGCTLFISGLDPAAILDDEDLRHALLPYGAITAASLNRDVEGVSLGFGTVTFATPAEATTARDGIEGKIINGRKIVAQILYTQQRPAAMRSMLMPEGARSVPNLAAYSNGGLYPRVPAANFNLPQQQLQQQGYYFPSPSPAVPSPHYSAPAPMLFAPQHGAGSNFGKRHEQAAFAQQQQQHWPSRSQMQGNAFDAYTGSNNISGLTRANSFPRMPFGGSNDAAATPPASFNDATLMASLNGDSTVLTPSQQQLDASSRQLGAPFVPRATGSNRAVGSGHASNRSGDSTGNSSGRGSVRSSFSGSQAIATSNGGEGYSSVTEVGEHHRRSISPMRTPAMTAGPWGDMPGLSGGRSFPHDAMSPESTMSSLGSVTSNASQVNTPDAFGRTVPLLSPSDDIWSASSAGGRGEWNADTTSAVFSSSAIQSLQHRSPPRSSGNRSKPMDPVGHEKAQSSSPKRHTSGFNTHSLSSLDLSRLDISA